VKAAMGWPNDGQCAGAEAAPMGLNYDKPDRQAQLLLALRRKTHQHTLSSWHPQYT